MNKAARPRSWIFNLRAGPQDDGRCELHVLGFAKITYAAVAEFLEDFMGGNNSADHRKPTLACRILPARWTNGLAAIYGGLDPKSTMRFASVNFCLSQFLPQLISDRALLADCSGCNPCAPNEIRTRVAGLKSPYTFGMRGMRLVLCAYAGSHRRILHIPGTHTAQRVSERAWTHRPVTLLTHSWDSLIVT